jgi:hypothetical protein
MDKISIFFFSGLKVAAKEVGRMLVMFRTSAVFGVFVEMIRIEISEHSEFPVEITVLVSVFGRVVPDAGAHGMME